MGGTPRVPALSDRVVRAIAVLSVLLACGCAAARGEVPPSRPTSTPTAIVEPEPPGATTQYRLSCRDRGACPDGVGLLVRPADPEAQRCTAVLVAPDRVLTASHCLAASERAAGAPCAEIWIGFAASGGAPMEWAACAEVMSAHRVDEDAVMQRDVALLRLRRDVRRTTHPVDARPPDAGSIVSVIAVRPHPIYPLYHELYERLCRVATRESAVETFGEEAAQVGWLIDCPSHGGNSGAPVLDARGHVRALLHGGSAPLHGIGVTSAL